MPHRIIFLVVLSVSVLLPGYAQSPDHDGCNEIPDTLNCKLLSDFESDVPGTPPKKWRALSGGTPVPLTKGDMMTDRKNIFVREENGNQFGRIHTDARGLRVVLPIKGNGVDWNLDKRPVLRWRWRAKDLPEGGDETQSSTNDTGGAVYVTFGTDWLGRPKSIKYTYSSTLPVGTSTSYGALKVLVVASKNEQGIDKWVQHERNVIEDYKELFGGTPDKTPAGMAIWGDSDTLNETSTVDFDDIMVLSGPTDDSSTAASP
jgi:hypothetical protein